MRKFTSYRDRVDKARVLKIIRELINQLIISSETLKCNRRKRESGKDGKKEIDKRIYMRRP